MESMKRQKDTTPEDDSPRSEGVQYATGEEQRTTTNSFRRNDVAGSRQIQRSVVNVSGDESKIQHCKYNAAKSEQY